MLCLTGYDVGDGIGCGAVDRAVVAKYDICAAAAREKRVALGTTDNDVIAFVSVNLVDPHMTRFRNVNRGEIVR